MAISRTSSGFTVSVSRGGLRYRRSFQFRTEAELWEAKALVALMQGEVPEGCEPHPKAPVLTLGRLAEVVYEKVWAGTRGEVTASINSNFVVAALGAEKDIRKIGVADGDTLIQACREAGNSPATINRKLAALSKMLSFAAARGWIQSKPQFERLRESEGRVRFLSRDEYERILHDLSENDNELHNLVVVLVETGLRLGEALDLKWENIDFSSGHIRVWHNKSDKPRSVPMSSGVRRWLSFIQARPDLYPGASERPFGRLTANAVRHRWDAMKARIGLADDKELTPHCCRHTFASWGVQKGISIFTVKELCGHRCIEVTMRYAHLMDSTAANAVNTVFG
jgi:integrase